MSIEQAPPPSDPSPPPDGPGGLPAVGDQYLLGAYRIRRCTFRRLTEVAVPEGAIYDVECLFPDRRVALPLGDLEVATPICNACTAEHIFRPDED